MKEPIMEDRPVYQLPKEVQQLAHVNPHNIAGGKGSDSKKVIIKGGQLGEA